MNRILKEKIIYKGRLLRFFVRKQKFPNGYVADLEVVKHPGAVLITPFLTDEKIILISQYRPVIGKYIWELPAGTFHKGENALLCARRELIEEVGYASSEWKKLGFIYPAPGYTDEKIIIFSAKKLKKVKTRREEDEVIRPKIFTKKEISRLLDSGRIVDAKTICALKLAGVC